MKSDLMEERKITYEQGKVYADKNNMVFYEASAKEGTNVETIFNNIAKKLAKQADENCMKSNKSIKLDENNIENKMKDQLGSCCCNM